MGSKEIEIVNAPLLSRPEIADCVVELKEESTKEEGTSCRREPVIFSVSKALRASDQQYYIPSLISVGPYHFGTKELSSMETHKTEALRRMERRIRHHGRSMQSVIENEIVAMDKRIREFYDKELPYTAIDLAGMVTKDACFLFEFMLNYVRTRYGGHEIGSDWVVEGRYDAVFSSYFMNPTWKKILYDAALFENQIPLFVLERLLAIAYSENQVEKILGDIFGGVAKRNSVFTWGMLRPYNKEMACHFLEGLYYYNVGGYFEVYHQPAYALKLPHGGKSIFSCSCWRRMRGRGQAWELLHPPNRDVKKRSGIGKMDSEIFRLKLRPAAELKKKGINFYAVSFPNGAITENIQSIQYVRFDEGTSTLFLPEMHIDHFRHALLTNFIALEQTSTNYWPAPITSYAFFMNELVDSEEDVAVLSEANIIKNFLGSDKEAAEYFNDLTKNYHWSIGCRPIDDAREGLQNYQRRKYKILWNEFLSTYCAKPWLVVGSIAATLLLLMTLLQVSCLFYTCNRST